MHSTKQKVNNAAAVGKEHVDILKAKAEEKAKEGVARSKGEKEIAHEERKAKEAEAKMKMHGTKAVNAEEKSLGKLHQHHHEPVSAVVPPTTETHRHAGWMDPK